MIPEFGLFALIIAFCMASSLALIPLVISVFPRFVSLSKLIKPLVFGNACWLIVSFLTLIWCFWTNDFSVHYVAQNSNTHLTSIYKICAVWGAHEGSLLLWVLILSLWIAGVAKNTQAPLKLKNWALSILAAISVGFTSLLLATSNPFARILPYFPEEGADLNPLLQDPAFVLHPPFLYMGYVGFAVPFAFAIAALIAGEKEFSWRQWAQWVRPWSLLAWGFLTIGITLGSWWAYYELGWGGWWFWDPVENASFIPWLIGAALVHALYVAAQQGTLVAWSLLLSLTVFILSLIGTFLVRSGVISSVHAFASDPERGIFILIFLAIVIFSSLFLYLWRVPQWKFTSLQAGFSRESFILLGNILLVTAGLTVLLGTLYPLASEVLSQHKLSVGPPYFNAVFVPIMLPAIVIMALAPYIKWGGENFQTWWKKYKKSLLLSLGSGLVAGALCYYKLSFLSILGALLGIGLIVATLLKITQRQIQWGRCGMLLAHLGCGLAVVGISLTTALQIERDLKMAPEESVQIAGYNFSFKELYDTTGPNYQGVKGHFVVSKSEKTLFNLYPEKRFFLPRELPISETAIHVGVWQDTYIALGEKLTENAWSVRIYLKPCVRWIWLGGLLIGMGAWLAGIAAFKNASYKLESTKFFPTSGS